MCGTHQATDQVVCQGLVVLELSHTSLLPKSFSLEVFLLLRNLWPEDCWVPDSNHEDRDEAVRGEPWPKDGIPDIGSHDGNDERGHLGDRDAEDQDKEGDVVDRGADLVVASHVALSPHGREVEEDCDDDLNSTEIEEEI